MDLAALGAGAARRGCAVHDHQRGKLWLVRGRGEPVFLVDDQPCGEVRPRAQRGRLESGTGLPVRRARHAHRARRAECHQVDQPLSGHGAAGGRRGRRRAVLHGRAAA